MITNAIEMMNELQLKSKDFRNTYRVEKSN